MMDLVVDDDGGFASSSYLMFFLVGEPSDVSYTVSQVHSSGGKKIKVKVFSNLKINE